MAVGGMTVAHAMVFALASAAVVVVALVAVVVALVVLVPWAREVQGGAVAVVICHK